MKRVSTWLLRLAIVALGAIVAALCIFALPAMWRGAEKDYSFNPDVINALHNILLIMYAAAVPFFYALNQSMQLLTLIDKNKAFSEHSVIALKRIAYSGVAISIAFAASLPFFYTWADYDDAPGLIIVGMMVVGASLTVSIFAALMQRLLHEAIEFKSENDLTV